MVSRDGVVKEITVCISDLCSIHLQDYYRHSLQLLDNPILGAGFSTALTLCLIGQKTLNVDGVFDGLSADQLFQMIARISNRFNKSARNVRSDSAQNHTTDKHRRFNARGYREITNVCYSGDSSAAGNDQFFNESSSS